MLVKQKIKKPNWKRGGCRLEMETLAGWVLLGGNYKQLQEIENEEIEKGKGDNKLPHHLEEIWSILLRIILKLKYNIDITFSLKRVKH